MTGITKTAIQKWSNQIIFADATKHVLGREITKSPMQSSVVRITSTELASLIIMMWSAPCSSWKTMFRQNRATILSKEKMQKNLCSLQCFYQQYRQEHTNISSDRTPKPYSYQRVTEIIKHIFFCLVEINNSTIRNWQRINKPKHLSKPTQKLAN